MWGAGGDVPPVRFAPARGARLAYQVWGSGPQTMVAVPPTAQNIEVAWEQPAIRAMLERFGSFCRYLHFDKRGTGCSDRSGRVADIDERVDDLRAVMDHAGIERAHLLGASEGGPMTLLFAATYPDRVEGIVLLGSCAALHPRDLTAEQLAAIREGHRRYAALWGTERSLVAQGFAPTLAAADPTFVTWHRRYERLAASQDALLELLELGLQMDVRDVLPSIDVPTLIVHRTGDRIVPVERAHELADALPRARLFEQPGDDHFAYAGDVEGWMDEVERFVTGTVRPPATSVPGRARAPSRPASSTARPPAARVRITTLGRFAVEIDGEEVATSTWGSRLARQLCKRLVAARGWPVTRDELFELLWPDETDRRVLGPRLSVQLSMVRRVLSGGVIADRESVRLDLAEVDTDLERLHRASTDTEVVATYGGELLPDDVYEAWTQGVRDEARGRFVLAARRLAAAALAAGDLDAALALAHRLLEADRYDEAAHQLVVTVLERSGAAREAERARDTWREAMAELGVPAGGVDADGRLGSV